MANFKLKKTFLAQNWLFWQILILKTQNVELKTKILTWKNHFWYKIDLNDNFSPWKPKSRAYNPNFGKFWTEKKTCLTQNWLSWQMMNFKNQNCELETKILTNFDLQNQNVELKTEILTNFDLKKPFWHKFDFNCTNFDLQNPHFWHKMTFSTNFNQTDTILTNFVH